MPINTKTCPHRGHRYNDISALRADAASLAAAEQSGTLKQHGNWGLGQSLNHLATWVNFANDGSPMKPPFFVRWIVKPRKQRYIREGLPRGVRIPGIKDGTLGTARMPTAEAMPIFMRAWGRLEATPPTLPNPLFGPLNHDEWINLNLRHAELHLGLFSVV